jgi:response regulator NasT
MPTRIILAEDDAVIRMDLKEELEKQGYLVVGQVGDGQSAVNLARELRPDLVVMDIRMPELDGIAAAEILTREKLAPTILLTAYSEDELIDRARVAGVVHYVTKPWRQSDLKAAINIALARFQEFRPIEEKVKDLEEALATRKVVERAKGVLMEKYHISEQEAFRRIQKLSMNNRKPMKDVAEAILLTEELNA